MSEIQQFQERLRLVTNVVRFAKRCENAYKLKAQLLVYSCLIDTTSGATPWLTFDALEQRVEEKLKTFSQQLPKALRWMLLEALGGRLIETSSEGYRLTRVGIAAVADHSARLQRHHAMQWEEKLREAQNELDEFE